MVEEKQRCCNGKFCNCTSIAIYIVGLYMERIVWLTSEIWFTWLMWLKWWQTNHCIWVQFEYLKKANTWKNASMKVSEWTRELSFMRWKCSFLNWFTQQKWGWSSVESNGPSLEIARILHYIWLSDVIVPCLNLLQSLTACSLQKQMRRERRWNHMNSVSK